MAQLDLGKLELIRRWSQYAAAAVLVVFVGLIVAAAFELHSLYVGIEKGQATLKDQEIKIADNEKKIKSQAQKIDDQGTTLKALINPKQQLNSDQAKQVRETVEANVEQTGGEKVIAARIYIQIGDESQRKRASEVVAELQRQGYIVPGIENVGAKAKLPRTSQLRYYQTDSIAQGDTKDITETLGRLGVNLSPVSLNSSAVRPRHYELWFGQDF